MYQIAGLFGHGGQRMKAIHFTNHLLALNNAGDSEVKHGQRWQGRRQQELATDANAMQEVFHWFESCSYGRATR